MIIIYLLILTYNQIIFMKKLFTALSFLAFYALSGLLHAQPVYETLIEGPFSADRVYDDSERRQIPASVMVWEESLVRTADNSYVVGSATPFAFTSLVVLWETGDPLFKADDFRVRFRVAKSDGEWTDWQFVEGAYHPEEVPRGLYVSELIMISDVSTYDQFELELMVPAGAHIGRLEVDLIDVTGGSKNSFDDLPVKQGEGKSPSGLVFPDYVPRSSWCLTNNACLNPTYSVTYIDATHTIIHYGAMPNNYESGAAVVYSYWDYHVNSNGWFDIGYNYLVDKYGDMYEGRHNPALPYQDVRAAHAGSSNAVSIGINFLGNTDNPALHPSEAQLGKNIQLLSWWYDYHGFDPTSSADIILQDPAGEIEERFRICGHRDVGATFCPGDVLYAELPGMRIDVMEAMIPDGTFYSVGAESLVGEIGNFPTFREAVAFINDMDDFSEDLIFFITGNLFEDCSDAGIGLAVDPSPYTITIKPAPGTTPTISFHYPEDVNAGPSGAFIIGMSGDSLDWTDAATAQNIIIDGSNTPDGTSRDLTITSTPDSHRNAKPLVLFGDVSHVEIKNLNVYHQAAYESSPIQVGFNGAITLRINHLSETGDAPNNILIHNCHLSVDFPGVSPGYTGFNVFKTTTDAIAYIENLSITHNLIEGKANGILLAWAGENINISNNEIRVNQDISPDFEANAGIQIPVTPNQADVSINANLFSGISTGATGESVYVSAIDMLGGGTFIITNNMIRGFEATADQGFTGSLRGVYINNAEANVLFAHNSMLLDALPHVNGETSLAYTAMKLVDGDIVMKNNIIAAMEGNFAYNLLEVSSLPSEMNHNLYYISSLNHANVAWYNGESLQSLHDWQVASGKDNHSLFSNPQYEASFDLRIQDHSPAKFNGTPLMGVNTDFFGSDRHAENPSIGAHENDMETWFYTLSFVLKDENGNHINDAVISLDGEYNTAGDYLFLVDMGTYVYIVESDCFVTQEGFVDVMWDVEHEVILEGVPGDANGDGLVNVLDVIEIANSFVFDHHGSLCFANADVNSDGLINVLDVIIIVNIFNDDKQIPHSGLR